MVVWHKKVLQMRPPITHLEEILKSAATKNEQRVPSRIPVSDQGKILRADIYDVLNGSIEIFDDRKPRLR